MSLLCVFCWLFMIRSYTFHLHYNAVAAAMSKYFLNSSSSSRRRRRGWRKRRKSNSIFCHVLFIIVVIITIIINPLISRAYFLGVKRSEHEVAQTHAFNVLLTVHHAMILGNCPTWCTRHSHQHGVTFTRSCIDTICFSWWWAWHARNMYRTKYVEGNLCVKLDNYQESFHQRRCDDVWRILNLKNTRISGVKI